MRARAHHRLRRAVEAFVDGELSRDEHAKVVHHLSVCWECSVFHETLRLMKAGLRRNSERAPVTLAKWRVRRFAEEIMTGS